MYKGFAHIYDEIMIDNEYEEWFSFLYGFSSLNKDEPETMLDLACGTGSLSIIADKKNIFVTAIDNSEMMLSKAREKSDSNGCEIEFMLQDMREMHLPYGYEIAVCLFDSINYITQEEELLGILEKVYSALVPGSIFYVEFAGIEKAFEFASRVLTEETDNYYSIWKSEFCPEKKYLNVNTTFFIKDNSYTTDKILNADIKTRQSKQNELYQKYQEDHLKRIYSMQEIEKIIAESSFEDFVCFSDYAFKKADKKSEQYIYAIGKGFKPGTLYKKAFEE